jgi:MFS transporter, SP family, sugar:H+ symporter
MYGLELGFVLIASIISGYIGSRWGRKIGLILCAVTGLLGSGLQMIAAWPAQLVGRVFMGMSIGFAGNFTITYWSETAPASMRGVIVILYQLFINFPNFLGACIDQGTHALQNRWAYRAPLLTTMLMPILLLCFIKIVPESPRE